MKHLLFWIYLLRAAAVLGYLFAPKTATTFYIFAVALGFYDAKLGKMMMDGVKKVAPTGVMLTFAILYFGIMIDAGLFDPVVKLVLRLVGGSPTKIVVGTFLLAAGVSLDGDGPTTYMITCAAMLPRTAPAGPLYRSVPSMRGLLKLIISLPSLTAKYRQFMTLRMISPNASVTMAK